MIDSHSIIFEYLSNKTFPKKLTISFLGVSYDWNKNELAYNNISILYSVE